MADSVAAPRAAPATGEIHLGDRFLKLCAWGVHIFTAAGAVFGLLAVQFAADGRFRASFVAMTAATIIDSADGPMARALQVRARVPWFDGTLLDNIVDYLTYVLAPAFLMLRAQMLPAGSLALAIAGAVMLASAYQFCQANAKT